MSSANPPRPQVIVTCGPSYEPIDEVRRITNQSTGELGVLLASRLARDGWPVICLKGAAATWPGPENPRIERLPFTTNDNLLERLRAVSEPETVAAVFHTAALCDFKVGDVHGEGGAAMQAPKISSREGALTLTLVPATKLIGTLRPLFPNAWIVGWKYELGGGRDDVLAKGIRQIAENRTDACVLNGAAYGPGFGVLEGETVQAHLKTKQALCDWLAAKLESRLRG